LRDVVDGGWGLNAGIGESDRQFVEKSRRDFAPKALSRNVPIAVKLMTESDSLYE
jgi:hypothetical protein